jgi:hypothetical protein
MLAARAPRGIRERAAGGDADGDDVQQRAGDEATDDGAEKGEQHATARLDPMDGARPSGSDVKVGTRA